jgi:hypothetical protein
MVKFPNCAMQWFESLLIAVQALFGCGIAKLISSLMNRTDPSQNAKYPPPLCALLKPSVQVS